jgi:hypothetical protein
MTRILKSNEVVRTDWHGDGQPHVVENETKQTKQVQHTQGPWTLQEHEDEPCQLIGNGTIHIADIFCTDFPTGAADARLIAAAPELLEASERLVKASATVGNLDHAGIPVPPEAWAEMYAANCALAGVIASATGKA